MKWAFHMPCMAEVMLTVQSTSALCWTLPCSQWKQQRYSRVGASSDAGADNEQLMTLTVLLLTLALGSRWQPVPGVNNLLPLEGAPRGAGISQILVLCLCVPHLPRPAELCHKGSCGRWLCKSWGHETLVQHPARPLIISQLGDLQWLSSPQLWCSSIWTSESTPNPLSTSFDAAVPEWQQKSFLKNL